MSPEPVPDPMPSWPLEGAEPLRDELTSAYASTQRGYHDLRHLREVLARLDELAEAGERFDALTVRLAAWFHDGVYDGQPDAEARSAEWAERALAPLLPADVVAEVSRLVRLTAHHRPAEDDPGGCALTDADLAILAAPPRRYREYADDVRREYASVPDEAFRRGRAAILRDLAAKPSLFHTEAARRRWERSARANLAHELATLEQPG
jgi:predicted metal-dependent HD superfamily phosphohydrolase